MKETEWNLSAGAVVLFALMYFFDGSGVVSAAVPAILAHELGHLLFLRLYGYRLRSVTLGVFGLELGYAGSLTGRRAIVCIAGGPVSGLAYALASCALGGAFWRMSGAVSFVLSVFNLLPILPLDGGRLAAEVTGADFAGKLSRVAAVLLTLCGVPAALHCHTLSLLLTGAWLTVCNFRSDGDDVCGV